MARQLVWITPDGAEFPLTNAGLGYRVMKGASGLGAPPVELSVDETPLLDGVEVTDVYAPPRTIQLPMLILATDPAAYRARALALVAAVLHGGECALELRQPDGQRRRINVWYSGGLEGLEDKDSGGEKWLRFVLKAFAPSPFWFDPVPITYRYGYSSGGLTFLGDPFLPLRIAQGLVLGDATISNPGNVLAWPVWTISPPAADVVLTDVDAAASISLAGTVPTGQTLQIVTEPRKTDVRLADGTDFWPALYGTPKFWPVQPGVTNVDLALTGAGVGSSVEVTFYPRYKTPW
jgi:hypothetical protein